jgi:phytoene/squalene synthetase
MEELVEGFDRFRARSWFLWPMQLLPIRRREAMYALYDFCREVDDIADGEASRSSKQTLLFSHRSDPEKVRRLRGQSSALAGLALAS